jgi:hypothetical protein
VNDDKLDLMLRPNDRWAASENVIDAMLDRAADEAERASRRPRRHARAYGVIGAAATLAVVGAFVTAGAMGRQPTFVPDATIPISYVTDSGREIDCTFYLAVTSWGGADIDEAQRWVAEHDWTGIGQRGYDLGEAEPVNAGDAGVDSKIPQAELDRLTVSKGIGTAIVSAIPSELVDRPEVGTVANSTCNWERH